MGWRAPISLLAYITEISAVSGRMARANGLRADDSACVHGNVGYGDAAAFESAAGVQDGVVLDEGGDQMRRRRGGALFRAQRVADDAENGGIVGFGAAAGEHDLRRTSANQRGYGFASLLDGVARSLAKLMHGTRIAEFSPEVREHGLEHRGMHGRGGVMVEIDALHKFALGVT